VVDDLVNQKERAVIREVLHHNVAPDPHAAPLDPEPNWTPRVSRDPKPLAGLAVM
jgi:hypothetical protein